MNSNLTRNAATAQASGNTESPSPDRHHSGDTEIVALYGRGRHIADRIARLAARGEGRRAALRRVAADLGLDVAEVRRAVRFKEAVDHIAENVGQYARRLILAGHRHLVPKRVMQLGRTHPDRQRFAFAQIAKGRHPLAKPRDGSAPPFDTLNFGEVRSRLARTAGALDRLGRGLVATAAEDWPPEAKLCLMSDHLDHVRACCSALSAMLNGHDTRMGTRSAVAENALDRRPGRTPGSPTIFRPGRALGFVAAARGIAEKNRRDLPRLLREVPPTGDEITSLVDRLRLLESAATRLAGFIGGRLARQSPRSPSKRSGSTGRAAVRRANLSRGVSLEEVPEGPSDSGGTYVVVFRNDAEVTIAVGALGTFDFPIGHYLYVGSAFGPGGVRARTGRHRTPVKQKPKWNVDYLTPHVTAVAVWWTRDTARRECLWSAALAATPGYDCPAPEFGARDCRKARAPRIGGDLFRCPAHLYRSLELPEAHAFARRLSRLAPGHAPVYWRRLGLGDRCVIVDPSEQAR